jgi:hypothetical protein
MSASATAAPVVVLLPSDCITLTREDGTAILVRLDALRAWLLDPANEPAIAPPAPAFVESPDGSVVTTVGPVITDALGNTYALNAAGQVVTNGVAETKISSNVVCIAYHLKRLWQKNKAGRWYVRVDPKSPYVQVPPKH